MSPEPPISFSAFRRVGPGISLRDLQFSPLTEQIRKLGIGIQIFLNPA